MIDDDEAIVDLLRIRLEELGHEVTSAMDASAGMMLAGRVKPDLITLDFQMPAGDGAQVYQRLRTNTFTAKTKIIFVTGRSQDELALSVPDDPDVRFLQKPIDVEALKRHLRELLGNPAPDGDVLDLDLP